MAITAPPTITALPTPPDPNDRSTFNTRAYPWSVAQQTFGTQLAAVASNVYNNALEANDQAGIATAQAGIATTKADEASASAALAKDWATKTNAEVVAGQGFGAKKYADDAALSAAAAAASALEAAGLVESYQGALAADPTLDKDGNPLAAGDWYINTATGFVRAYNGSAWVQGISVVAGVSSINGLVGGLTGFVTETGGQTLTNKTIVDPIITLGATQGTAGQVPVSQGAGLAPVWQSPAAGGFSNVAVFTSSGTWTVPSGVTKCKVTVVGGGGAGGDASTSFISAGGGGGGGAAIKIVSGLTPGSTVSVTVGAATGTSSFGAHCSATGGSSATTASSNRSGGSGGIGSGGDLNIGGSAGGSGGDDINIEGGGAGGCSIFGGGGNGGFNGAAGGGGRSYGGGGGGGGGSDGGTGSGGAGAAGVVVVEY